jgi:hypothetical protein
MTTTDRKAQGLPINTIIIAILAIAVLFVILFVFFRKGGEFTQSTNCEGQGGGCVSAELCSQISSGIKLGPSCAGGNVCCKAIVPQEEGQSCASNTDCVSRVCGGGNTCTHAS